MYAEKCKIVSKYAKAVTQCKVLNLYKMIAKFPCYAKELLELLKEVNQL